MKRLGVQYLKSAADDQERAIGEYGQELATAIDRVIERIRVLPQSAPVYLGIESQLALRRVLVQKYKFVVYYYLHDIVITVVAVAPQRVAPGYWHNRVER